MKRIWLPQVIASVMLLWALKPDTPYGYYNLLRVVCCSIFAFLSYKAYEQKKQDWTWILGVTAFIYNPILRIHLTREIWSIINIITIIIVIVSIFTIFKETRN